MPTTGTAIAAWWGGTAATAATATTAATAATVGASGTVMSAAAVAAAGAAASAALAPSLKAPTPPPILQSPDGSAAANSAGNRARGAGGTSSTNLTGPQGLTDPATTAPKTLLGS